MFYKPNDRDQAPTCQRPIARDVAVQVLSGVITGLILLVIALFVGA